MIAGRPIIYALKGVIMARKLLFAVDFSPYTEKLIGCAGELASVGYNEVVLLHAIDSKMHAEYGDHPDPAHDKKTKIAQEEFDKIVAEIKDQGLNPKAILETGNPVEIILETAKKEDVDLIFMGGHGRTFFHRHIIGSVTEKVMKLADRPVMIQHCRVKKGDDGYSCENVCTSLFGNILVACDFSEYSKSVEPILLNLASIFCTPITLLHVQEGKADGGWRLTDGAEKEKAREEMAKLQDLSGELGRYCSSVKQDIVRGSPASAILGYAEEVGATMIIIGAFGIQGVIDGMLGSVAEKVVRGSEIPVLVLKVAE
jgi:nucleotide-binding universal stress UspA family protein